MRCWACEREVQDGARFCPWCGTALQADNDQPHLTIEAIGVPGAGRVDRNAKPRRRGDGVKMALAFMGIFFAFFMEVIGATIAVILRLDLELMSLVFGTFGAALALLTLGGLPMLRPRLRVILSVLRQGWWALAVSLGLAIYEFVTYYLEGTIVIDEGTPERFVYLTALCLFVGLSEEFMFRGLLQGGLMAAFGGSRRGFYATVLASSVLFGAAHVMWADLDYSDVLQIAQALLKILQTGVYAVFLASQVVRTREVVGVGLLHGLGDWLLLFVSAVLAGEPLETEYVVSGDDALPTIALYLVVIALYIPLVVRAVKELRKAQVPDFGPLEIAETSEES